jgi:hypothetical protein
MARGPLCARSRLARCGSRLGRSEAPAPACSLAAMAPDMVRAMPRRGLPCVRCPRRGPGPAWSWRPRSVRPDCSRSELGLGAARSRRVSAALRALVLAWCTRCLGTVRRAPDATCSATPRLWHTRLPPRHACLPLDEPVYPLDHPVYPPAYSVYPPCILCAWNVLFILYSQPLLKIDHVNHLT